MLGVGVLDFRMSLKCLPRPLVAPTAALPIQPMSIPDYWFFFNGQSSISFADEDDLIVCQPAFRFPGELLGILIVTIFEDARVG